MRQGFLTLILVCACQAPVFAADNTLASPEQRAASGLPSVAEILTQMRANFSREALFIKGQILSGGRIGKLERVCYLEMFLDLGKVPAVARYVISDGFGTPLEQMTISMAAGGKPEIKYEAGNPLQPAVAPAVTRFIRDTDVTWNDLSFSFLWRTDGRPARAANLRGRDCHVLEFPRADGGTEVLWVDAQMLVLIQMEELDREGKLQRRMIVKNIKKISEQWIIKDLEIRSYPSLHHTLVRVDEVSTPAAKGASAP